MIFKGLLKINIYLNSIFFFSVDTRFLNKFFFCNYGKDKILFKKPCKIKNFLYINIYILINFLELQKTCYKKNLCKFFYAVFCNSKKLITHIKRAAQDNMTCDIFLVVFFFNSFALKLFID